MDWLNAVIGIFGGLTYHYLTRYGETGKWVHRLAGVASLLLPVALSIVWGMEVFK